MDNKISVIIPAAGLATRLKPLTDNISKTMIPINGKPIISYIFDILKNINNIEEVIIVDNVNKNDIREYFNRINDFNFNLLFKHQKKLNGPLDAIKIGYNSSKKDNDILIWLSDTLINNQNVDIKKYFNKPKNSFFITSKVNEIDTPKYCIYDNDLNNFTNKKLNKKTDALTGIYYLRNIDDLNKNFSEINENNYDISDLLIKFKNILNIDISLKDWLDCGNFENLYKTKAILINSKSREFNKINLNTFDNTITKSVVENADENFIKTLENEISWYKKTPNEFKMFIPQIYDIENNSIKMNYENGYLLSDLLLYHKIENHNIDLIANKIFNILKTRLYNFDKKDNYNVYELNYKMFIEKNIKRLDNYKYDFIKKENLEKIKNIIKIVGYEFLKNVNDFWSQNIFGDLHPGNIIFNPENGSIKFIDPRGNFGGITTNEGDIRYDIGKLYHDIYAGYNYIISKQYKIENDKILINFNNNYKRFLYNLDNFAKSLNINVKTMKILSGIFLVTCLPFHNDNINKQKALYLMGENIILNNF